jgi:aspartyl-tRNA(Asn)/glutamyl-tRNA(Gln) amidotransferase subunit B
MSEEMQEACSPARETYFCQQLIDANPEKALQAKTDSRIRLWFIGQVMKASYGKANPVYVQVVLESLIGVE